MALVLTERVQHVEQQTLQVLLLFFQQYLPQEVVLVVVAVEQEEVVAEQEVVVKQQEEGVPPEDGQNAGDVSSGHGEVEVSPMDDDTTGRLIYKFILRLLQLGDDALQRRAHGVLDLQKARSAGKQSRRQLLFITKSTGTANWHSQNW